MADDHSKPGNRTSVYIAAERERMKELASKHGHGGEASSDAHARNDERQAARVYDFDGDDQGHAAGQVNVVAKGKHGEVTVRPVGGGDEFQARRDALTPVASDDEADEAPEQA